MAPWPRLRSADPPLASARAPAGPAPPLHRPGRLDSRWSYVGNTFVRAEHRNRGVGAALLSAIVATAEARGYVRLVLSPTARAIPLYRRAGFVPAGGEHGELLLVRPAPATG